MIKKIKNIEKNAYVFSLFSKILTASSGLVYSVLFSRYFQSSLRGSFSVISTYADLIVLFLCMGMYQGYPYFKRKSGESIYSSFVNMTVAFFVVYSFIAMLLFFAVGDFFEIKTVCLLVPFMFATQQFNYIVLIENPKVRNSAAIVLSLFDIVLLLFFSFIFAPSVKVLVLFLYIKECIYFGIAFLNLKIKITEVKPSFAGSIKYIKFGVIPMITLLMMDLNYKADIVMLDWFKISKSEIGVYSLGLSLAQKLWMIPDALKDILLSKLAAGRKEDEVCKVIRVSLFIMILSIVFVAIIGKYVIVFLYGKEYKDSYSIMLVLLIGIIGMVFYKMIYSYNIVNGLRRVNLLILGFSASINIILNYILIPSLHIKGAAIASTVSYSLCGMGFLFFFSRRSSIGIKEILIIKKIDIKQIIRIVRYKD